MGFPADFEYVRTIASTSENARAIQALILQDVLAAGADDPLKIGNPNDVGMVTRQQENLDARPECYSGYARDGQLMAYIKQGPWLRADELPFTTGLRAVSLKASRLFRLSPDTGQWGVFGLVALNTLDKDVRNAMLVDLLRRSFKEPQSGEMRTVNIILHGQDPIHRVMPLYGFVPVGKPAEAVGVPGITQQLYQRMITE